MVCSSAHAQIATPGLTQTFTAPGNSKVISTINLNGNNYNVNHTVQAFSTGSPTTCTAHLWGTLKRASDNPVFPTDYADLSGSIDCTTVTMFHVVGKPVVNVVIQLATFSGGTTPTVTFRYIGNY